MFEGLQGPRDVVGDASGICRGDPPDPDPVPSSEDPSAFDTLGDSSVWYDEDPQFLPVVLLAEAWSLPPP
eukprot:CAMPEP_0173441856 /NCGR_PEP_ID=MMETSP1357-20121228/24184_1 /TAXON_ID=77926 /ORGANISM="Hemiselmis rufescens, Strain PCC563" /LENGTH=69 /DNA_ID=CAMNT_0014407467 /DNA_START=10 /DNA_END=215 /DNA_ORIENTATION=+